MSCQLKLISKVVDLQDLKKCLFSSKLNSDRGVDEDPWNWSVEEESHNKESWLSDCHISLSPSGELLAFAHKNVMIILTAKWDTSEKSDVKMKYMITWQGDPRKDNSEHISCILCLPIAAQGRQSSQHGTDWTCIAVGFSSGAVRFYTETGSLLISEVLHYSPVIKIKCQSFQPARFSSESQQMEEIFINYESIVCCIRGFALCNTLRACRNQLARVQAHCKDQVEAPSLDLVKWSLVDQESIFDMSVIGSLTPLGLTHLATASVRGGFDASYRSSPPNASLVVAAGLKPYIGFHYVIEGSATPVLSDVAKAVATKLKSAIGQAVPGWLGRGKRNSIPEKSKEKVVLEPPEAMSCRFGLSDALREGISIITCQQRNLSAVCDGLGRIVLIDNTTGLAVRMWKGYREAECAFFSVEENKNSLFGRNALFLVIYAPKKGLIEVWALQQGPKLITFSVPKMGKLLYINYGLLGVNCTSLKGLNNSQHPCVFIDSCGSISQIVIPFHAILNDKNNKRNKDLHILKQIKRALHNELEDEVKDLCLQLSTSEICHQTLDLLCSYKRTSLDLLTFVISKFQEKLSHSDSVNLDKNSTLCLQACENLQRLINFYNTVYSYQSQPPKYSTVVHDSPSECFEDLANMLKMPEAELQKLMSFISMNGEKGKVSFQQQPEESFSSFVLCFLQGYNALPPLKLSNNVSHSALSNLGKVMCQGALYGSCSATEWKEAALESKIEPNSLLRAALSYWLSKPHGNNLYSELTLFAELSTAICLMTKTEELEKWWPEVRSQISKSENPCNSLTAATVMRAVCLTIEEKLTDNELEWETVSEELCAWSQLTSQLEALAHLSVTINSKHKITSEQSSLPILDYLPPVLSLSNILLRGPGSVSELVAKWVGSLEVSPDLLLLEKPPTLLLQQSAKGSVVDGMLPPADSTVEAVPTTKEEDLILNSITTLRDYFPHSLSSGPLIANLAWEYFLGWSKDLDKVEILNAALKCIKVISIPHLKQGICSIIWNIHLRNRFESIIKLLHKMGKVPKEGFCRHDLNMSDSSVKYFLASIVSFFKIFLESCSSAVIEDRVILKREALWTEESQPSLAEVAVAQTSPNSDLLLVLNQCATALYMLSTFSLHFQRPITNLFDSIGESCLWSDISSFPQLPKHNFDPKLQDSRIVFLKKVITAAVKPLSSKSSENKIKEAVGWMSLCFSLASDWCLSPEVIRIHLVCQLYINNCDRLAEEIASAVNDREGLGGHLLRIAGQRMKIILTESSSEIKERMANLSPSLTLWIKQQEGIKTDGDLREISTLTSLALNLLPESNPDHKIAALLVEAIQPLAI